NTDGGITCTDHNTNRSITPFTAGCLHPTDPNFALGGSVDNGTEKWSGTNSWQFVDGGDGGPCAISSGNPDNHWAWSLQYLSFLTRTLDGGVSAQGAAAGIDLSQSQVFPAPLEKCPHNDDVLITGNETLWRTSDFFSAVAPTWSANSPRLLGDEISALAFAPLDTTCSTYAFGTQAFNTPVGNLR